MSKWKEDERFIDFVQTLFALPEIKELIEKDDWTTILNKVVSESPILYFSGYLIDFLIYSGVIFDTFLTELPIYCMYGSELVESLDLRNVTFIGSRAFRKSSIKSITLSRKLTNVGTAIFSSCLNNITIYWQGSAAEWEELCKDEQYLSAYQHKLTIQCSDKNLEYNYDSQTGKMIKRWY